ncbi:mannonate dehydratase, partial [Acidobacteria bacterium AH-259-A15]|nr:mannonate dehydratase [Acidobacteria bacterium AH-259-A15]
KKLVGGVIGAGVASSANPGTVSAQAARIPRENTLMHVGGDYHSVAGGPGADITGKENLEFNLRHGVKHLTAKVRKLSMDGAWDLDDLKGMKDNCDKYGVIFEAIRMNDDYIRLRKGPERDRRLETIRENIRKASQVGVKIITHHWRVIPIRRNRRVAGRGGVTYNGFKLEDNWEDLAVGESGRVTSEDYWERITYFLEKVIPVAKEYDVRMACHPYDPPGLPFGYQGAENWDSPSVFEAIKRYESIVDSPYNGFQLCLGTTGEGLRNPKTAILPIVEYLGERGKIHQIHMRNIRGGLHDFSEVYPDEGEMDFLKIIRILRDVQFSGAFCPDHMPSHPDDPGKFQAFAFGYGYIKALIHAVNSEV